MKTSTGEVTETRTCMLCGEKEGHGVVVYPVWAWDGKFMGRWCDWCRELRCWDCSELQQDCGGACGSQLMASIGLAGDLQIDTKSA